MVMFACMYSNSKICVEKSKKAWNYNLSVNFHNFVVVSYSHADCVVVRSNLFLLVEWLFDSKLLLNGHVVTQNYNLVVFYSEATKNKSHDYLIRHAKKTTVLKIPMQFRSNFNYMANQFDCFIEICNIRTIIFGYWTYFLSQFTFKIHLAWNAFDCLLWLRGPGVMMVNIGGRVVPLNIAFSSSRNAT